MPEFNDVWERVRHGLAEVAADAAPAPGGGRVGAALALLSDPGDGDLALLYTRRRDDLSHHPGQISFPGGRVEPGESVQQAALREAAEECALDPGSVTPLGRLPAFYIPPSRFWLQVVVARWDHPHRLRAAEAEVAALVTARVSQLTDPARWRVTRLSTRGSAWAWDLGAGHLLWGATAIVTAVLLGLIDPDWHGGATPDELGAEREERPWLHNGQAVPRAGPARLADVPEVDMRAAGRGLPGRVDEQVLASAARVTADALAQLLPRDGRVLVVAGPGRTGAVGVRAAALLAGQGAQVEVVLPAGASVPPEAQGAAAELGGRVRSFDGAPLQADLVCDALVGRGLHGQLRGAGLDLVHALRAITAPVVSVDLPSGLHPEAGLVGDAIAADVTLALGAPAPGLLHDGLAPFVGDLYVVNLAGAAVGAADPIVRVVPEDHAGRAGR